MKKIYLFLFAFIFCFTIKANAMSSCTMERNIELTNLANNVNVDYYEYKKEYGNDYFADLVDGETDYEPGFYLRIYNLTNDLNIKLTKVGSKDSLLIYSKDAGEDGVIYYDSGYPGEIYNYTLSVRSNDPNCENEPLRQMAITVPKLNHFYDYDVCRDNQDYYMCQEYTSVDYSNITDDQFMKQVDEFIKKKEEKQIKDSSFMYRLLIIIKKYLWLIIAIIILGVGYYVYTRNKNSKGVK